MSQPQSFLKSIGFSVIVMVVLLLVMSGLYNNHILPISFEYNGQEIPVPLSHFVGGSAYLNRGQAVEFTLYQPNEKGTLVAGEKGYAQVRGLLGETPDTAILSVQTEVAPILQAALVDANVKIVYHSLERLPTSTPAPAQTKTPTPTPTLMSGYVYWSIPLAVIKSDPKLLTKEAYVRLVIVRQSEPVESGGTPSALEPFESCVRIEAVPPKKGSTGDQTNPAGDNEITLQLPAIELAAAIQAVQQQVRVDLIPDPSCAPK